MISVSRKATTASGFAFSFRPTLVLGATVLVLSACSDFFSVDNPGSLLDPDLENPQLETTLSGTAEARLSTALRDALRYGEMTGDAVYHPSIQDFGLNIDAGYRDRDNVMMDDIYTDLAQSRWVADDMVRRLQNMVPDPGVHLGVANSYFWGGVALITTTSYYREVTIDGQAPITPAQAIEEAIARFQQAAQVAEAAGDQNLRAGALGAIARAYRSLYYEPLAFREVGDPAHFAQAESFARQALDLDPDFRVNMRYGSPGPGQYTYTGRELPDPEYLRRIDPASGEPDPRTPADSVGWAPWDWGIFIQLRQWKFADASDPMPVSRAAEAELIIAEARFVAGDMDAALEFINRVRARSDLSPVSSSDPDAIWAQLIYERDTEMWLEGRKWEDHRYYHVVPKVWHEVNKQEGTAKRWPMSVQERANNPNV